MHDPSSAPPSSNASGSYPMMATSSSASASSIPNPSALVLSILAILAVGVQALASAIMKFLG